MNYQIHQGDCLEVMPTLEANSVDTVITDPPYGLGFMGKHWDHGVPGVQFWREALRVAKPGAMLLAFGGTRTFHRLTCAIEDAGWEVRDVLTWLYGSGFPKSHDISKAIDKAAGAEREIVGTRRAGIKRNGRTDDEGGIFVGGLPEALKQAPVTAPATEDARTWQGWGTALKPAWEPIVLAMKPLDGTFAENALRWGCAGLNVDGARIAVTDSDYQRNASGDRGHDQNRGRQMDYAMTAGHANSIGRWPANVVLDEEAAAMLDEQSGDAGASAPAIGPGVTTDNTYGKYAQRSTVFHADTGGASRFFYVAKAARSERNHGLNGMEARSNAERDGRNQYKNGAARNGSGELVNGDRHIKPQTNHHPTVKPVELMRYLCRLTATPFGGVVLDPFMGSGTTGVACVLEGRRFVGIDLDPHYCAIAERRIAITQPALLAE